MSEWTRYAYRVFCGFDMAPRSYNEMRAVTAEVHRHAQWLEIPLREAIARFVALEQARDGRP